MLIVKVRNSLLNMFDYFFSATFSFIIIFENEDDPWRVWHFVANMTIQMCVCVCVWTSSDDIEIVYANIYLNSCNGKTDDIKE